MRLSAGKVVFLELVANTAFPGRTLTKVENGDDSWRNKQMVEFWRKSSAPEAAGIKPEFSFLPVCSSFPLIVSC